MSKTIVWIVALATAGSTAFFYRSDLAALGDAHLPQHVMASLRSVAGDLVPPLPTAGSGPTAQKREGAGAPQQGGPGKGKRGAGPAPVTAAVARLQDMPITLQAPGTVEPLASVGLKSRVDGQVIEVAFKEGDLVTAGDVLFRLDERLVLAQIRQAEAAITKDKASLKDASSNRDRKETLLRQRYASEATTETARQQVAVLMASIAAGEAALEMQKTQLDYLTIRAPITGRTGSITAKLGTFVRSADPSFLVTINQTKPIAVAFALPQANLPALKAALTKNAQASITVAPAPGSVAQTVKGTLTFVDNQVDKSTGTVTAKVTVDNVNESLWPGQAVGVALVVETRKDMVAVPAGAVLPAQQGMISWVIDAGEKVSVRVVEVDRVVDQTAFLKNGLKAGERVVTDGQLRLTKGARVMIRDPNAPAAKGGKSGKQGQGDTAGRGGSSGKAGNDKKAPADSETARKTNGRS